MRYFFLMLLWAACTCGLTAQTWTHNDEHRTGRARWLVAPKTFLALTTEPDRLRARLQSAPHERDTPAEQSDLVVRLPAPDGTFSKFSIVRYDLFARPEAYPTITTYYGINIDQPLQTVFMDWTERGFHAAVSGGGQPGWYIDPAGPVATGGYLAYFRDQAAKPEEPFSCNSKNHASGLPPAGSFAGDCILREYDVAIATTPAYSNYHGAYSTADAALVHSAITTTLNRVNQIYTRDLSVRLRLIEDNELLYAYNDDDTPFSSDSISILIRENPAVLDERVGNDSYDIGHVFTQGSNNGRAILRSACDGEVKGGAVTSHIRPNGDPFNVDYVAHEFGHQLGANHTQNNAFCNYSPVSGMEPGSGSTIMGYAGICFPSVQFNSDDYFHGRSIEEITAFTENPFIGGRCAVELDNDLFNPRVTNLADHLLPAGTPFKLTGSASGPGGGTISYSWEQYDPEAAQMPPLPTATEGPLFRSLPPTTNPARYFPKLAQVVSGQPSEWEVLPITDRSMNFRLTVRNTKATYGCAGEQDITLEVEDNQGPFIITDPHPISQWSRGQVAQVRWASAGTEAPAFNSPTVDVLVSVDGGKNFTPVLTGTPNDGLAEITAPDVITDSLRVLVSSNGNVFYNVSTADISITDTLGPPAITLRPTGRTAVADCFRETDEVSFDFVTTSDGGATAPLQLAVDDLPAGLQVRFTPGQPRPGGVFTVHFSGLSQLRQGTYGIGLSVVSSESGQTLTEEIFLVKLADDREEGPAIIGPQGVAADIRPTLSVRNTEAPIYHFQVSARQDFSTLICESEETKPYFTLPEYLVPSARYYWRVRTIRGTGGCGISDWSVATFFAGECPIYRSTAAPIPITTGPPPQTLEMKVRVPDAGTVDDVDLFQLDVRHSYLNDLSVALISPEGTEIPILSRKCAAQDNLFLSFDDEGSFSEIFCPPVDSAAFVRPPETPLSRLDGESITGDWTVRVRDHANQDGGSFRGFQLKLCLENENILPVELLQFSATGRKADILLQWATANETDNLGFFVERARAATPGEWKELGFVPAGNDYEFIDVSAAATTDYFYRLRQTDLDGRVAYSDLRAARIGGPATTLRLFPNPSSGWVSYHWAVAEHQRGPLAFRLTDAHGRSVQSGDLQPTNGALDLRALPAGVYFLRVKGQAALRIVRL